MAYFKNHKYVKTFKIELDASFGEDVYIILREPTTEEAFKLRTEDEGEAIKVFKELMADLMVDHSFYEDETSKTKLDSKEVADIIYQSFPSYQKVLSEYTGAVFQSK